jgi:RNA polymerase sigma factor (sigma-70 family)
MVRCAAADEGRADGARQEGGAMRIPDLPLAQCRKAADGDFTAMDALLRAIEPGVFNLAVRMLGNLEDARDASQEILLKIVTHLGGFRGEAAFSTWVYRIAHHHLLNAVTRSREAPAVSFEAIADKLAHGLDYGRTAIPVRLMETLDSGTMSPEDKADAADIALGCTQGMLMALDRDLRAAYLLDVIFGLTSEQAGEVVGVTAAAFRKRLSRARERLHGFVGRTCGLADADAPCSCDRQLPAVRARDTALQAGLMPQEPHLRPPPDARAKREFEQWRAFGDAVALFRHHPDYRPPGEMIAAIRALLTQHGYLPAAHIGP